MKNPANQPPAGRWQGESAYWPADPLSGADILQLTGNISIATNIYCEDPACSPANRIVIFRSTTCDAAEPAELWVADVEKGRSILVDRDASWVGAGPQAYGTRFYYPRFFESHWELRELSLDTLEHRTVREFRGGSPRFRTLGSASPDGRYLATLHCEDDDNNDVFVMDIETGDRRTIARGHDWLNPHPRFDRMQGDWVLVQHNRGHRRSAGGMEVTDPNVGVTLVLCRRDGSEQQTLPIARPFIPQGVSGHEAWIKGEPAFVYSTAPMDPPYDDGTRRGNLLLYRVGDDRPSVLADAPDLYFGHVSTSACGRYWCCDAWKWPHDGQDCCRCAPVIYVGDLMTRRFAPVCEVGGCWPRYENGHSHPYLSADNRHVVFTSTRAGFPQVFRATLPEGFLTRLR